MTDDAQRPELTDDAEDLAARVAPAEEGPAADEDELPPRDTPPEGVDPDEWLHVDPAHPRPWAGCIRRGLCCQSSPGWFAPGEAERAAALLGREMGDFVNEFLVLDFHETTVGRIEGFVPVKLGRDGEPMEPTGARVSGVYRMWDGPCVFFDGEGCGIYGARPLECRLYDCTHLPEDNPSKLDVALLWLGAWKAQQAGRPFPVADLVDLRDLQRWSDEARVLMGVPRIYAAVDDEGGAGGD